MKNPYKDDYLYNPRLSSKGRIVDDICYVGDYYILPFDQKKKRTTAICNILFAIVIFGWQILMGCVNQSSSRTVWVVFPYFFSFIPNLYFLLGAYSYTQSPVKMQKIQFEQGIERMRRSGFGILFFTILSASLDVLYMILHTSDMIISREVIYFLLHVGMLGLVFAFRIYYAKAYASLYTEESKNKLE